MPRVMRLVGTFATICLTKTDCYPALRVPSTPKVMYTPCIAGRQRVAWTRLVHICPLVWILLDLDY
jgi:hypothetical protein